MSTFPLLDVQTTLVRARDLRARIDAESDPRRVVTDLSLSTIASLAILVGQLDEIAQAAAAVPMTLDEAAFVMVPADLDRLVELRGLLLASGYLSPASTPSTDPTKEPAHGEG